jgi:glyceraldehyde 3-phosphate dehydrogenase/D-erythrose 4-phosphate dehydrogenase
VLRALYERQLTAAETVDSIHIVAINELADIKTLAHLTKYDSTHGRFPFSVDVDGHDLLINGDRIAVTQQQALSDLDWSAQEVDLVLECTGRFTDRASGQAHLDAGAKRVMFSQPGEADLDLTVVYGINHGQLNDQHRLVSSASCTTNCIIPVIQILEDAFGIDAGTITTIHSAMNDQPVIDAYHHTDLRKTRAAGRSIIPVDTGLAKGISRILPAMDGKFTAHAIRVPTENVSAMDMVLNLNCEVTAEQVNRLFKAASQHQFVGIMGYTEEPLASCDFNHDARSVIVDASQTRVSGSRLLKVLCWFDNEWAYANRMLDIAVAMHRL